MPTLTELVFFSLLTWRITVLATFDRGPGDVLTKFRSIIGIVYDERSNRQSTTMLGEILNCHFCASMWIGWIVALVWLQDWKFIIVGLALSAGSLIISAIKPTI